MNISYKNTNFISYLFNNFVFIKNYSYVLYKISLRYYFLETTTSKHSTESYNTNIVNFIFFIVIYYDLHALFLFSMKKRKCT